MQTDDPLIYAVDSLLTRKLGLADALEQRILRYQAHVAVLMRGISDVSDQAENVIVTRPVNMINVAVQIEYGSNLIPRESTSYSRIRWVDVATFLDVALTRDVTMLAEDLNVFEFCVRGLCVQTTCELLKRRNLSANSE